MAGLGLALAPGAAAAEPPPARAATGTPRPITLAEAVELALRVEPAVAAARVGVERAKLGVMRANLDRVSLKIDGTLSEYYNVGNIGGGDVTYRQCAGTYQGQPFAFPNQLQPPLGDALCQTLLSGSTSPVTVPGQVVTNTIGTSLLQAQLFAPLFSGFRVTANVRRAERLGDLAAVSVRQASRDTALAVARAYWQVRRLGVLGEVNAGALVRMRDAEKVTDARVQAGLAPVIDRNRATSRRLQLEQTLADLAGQARESSAQLAVALGLHEELRPIDPLVVPESGPAPVEELVRSARAERPEVRSAALQLKVQDEVVRIAQSGYYPELDLVSQLQLGNNLFQVTTGSRSATSVANPFSGVTGLFFIGGRLTMNFFDTFNTYTAVKDARYERARLEEERRRVGRVVEADVRTAHAHLERLYARRDPARASRDVARDNLKILEARYKNGEALVIEYLDAQIELVNAELSVADLEAQIALAWIELDAALGHVVGLAREEARS